MPSFRLAKIAGLVILVLLVGSNLVLPAGAHITKRLPHLQRHLDPRYVNVNETTSFMTGPGKVIEGAVNASPNTFVGVLNEPGLLAVNYTCPSVVSNNGAVVFFNLTSGLADVFMDNGSDNPFFDHLEPNGTLGSEAAAAGEYHTFQISAPNVGIATVHVMSIHRASICHIQAQAVISS
jgi:hypothetical protein